MQNKGNWLLTLWRREWDYWERQLIGQLRTELICIGVVFVLFVMSGALTNRFSSYIASMPTAVLAFWGLPEGVSAMDSLFYMHWILMPLNVWIAWEACSRAMKAIWREEEAGQIFMLCNQWYTRYQIGIAKYTWISISFVVKYVIFFLVYICLALVACRQGQRGAELKSLVGLGLKSLLVIQMLISLSVCHAMLHKRRKRGIWTDVLVLGTLLLGNLYKVRGLLELLMKQTGRDYTGILRALRWLNAFKGLAPLSWLNPFTEYRAGVLAAQVIFCIMMSGITAVLGLVGYRVRKFI